MSLDSVCRSRSGVQRGLRQWSGEPGGLRGRNCHHGRPHAVRQPGRLSVYEPLYLARDARKIAAAFFGLQVDTIFGNPQCVLTLVVGLRIVDDLILIVVGNHNSAGDWLPRRVDHPTGCPDELVAERGRRR